MFHIVKIHKKKQQQSVNGNIEKQIYNKQVTEFMQNRTTHVRTEQSEVLNLLYSHLPNGSSIRVKEFRCRGQHPFLSCCMISKNSSSAFAFWHRVMRGAMALGLISFGSSIFFWLINTHLG